MTPYEALNTSYNDYLANLENTFVGKDATFIRGKFAGRKGRIDRVHLVPKYVSEYKRWYFIMNFEIYPYYKKKEGVDKMSSEARRMKHISEFVID